jgi:hypothetical protein
MKRFYVNSIYDKNIADTPYGVRIIGLFGDHGYEGRGNFCGWYGAEYYLNTKLYAHYLADSSGLYSPEKRVSEVVVHDPAIEYDEVQIGSGYWELIIEAETVEEAIEKFSNGDWRK